MRRWIQSTIIIVLVLFIQFPCSSQWSDDISVNNPICIAVQPWVVNENVDIKVFRAWLVLGLIAGDTASGSALRRWHPRVDLVGVTLEDDRFAINENGMVMAFADCPPYNEIPTPDRLAVVFP